MPRTGPALPSRRAAGPKPEGQVAARLDTPIQTWLEQFTGAYAQKPEPEGAVVVIELDKMWYSAKKSPRRSGSGRLGIVLQGSWWTENAAVVTRLPASA